jgi:hypothetical protein
MFMNENRNKSVETCNLGGLIYQWYSWDKDQLFCWFLILLENLLTRSTLKIFWTTISTDISLFNWQKLVISEKTVWHLRKFQVWYFFTDLNRLFALCHYSPCQSQIFYVLTVRLNFLLYSQVWIVSHSEIYSKENHSESSHYL